MTAKQATDLSDHLFDFVRQTHDVKDLTGLNDLFGDIVGQYGYSTFICTEIIGDFQHTKPSLAFGKWDENWGRRYLNKQYFRFDDCLRFLNDAKNIFSWEDVKNSSASTVYGRKIMNEAGDYGQKHGLIVPIRSFDGRMSLVTLMGENVDDSPDANTAIEIASLFFSETGVRLSPARPRDKRDLNLTPRQLEILKWIAIGKRNQDVADILSITKKTVERHLEDARRRFNVLTTNQLLVECVKQGILQV